jgi:hypothetical protein
VQAVAEVHDTAFRNPLVVAGLGTERSDQRVPFQASASIRVFESLLMKLPTPKHEVADAQETPLMALTRAPGWFGVAWIAQLLAFERSASIDGGTWRLEVAPPTAVQAVAAEHDTADSWAWLLPDGVAADWIVQIVPFHCSASVPAPKPAGTPTAVQSVAVGHETPLSSELPAAGLGVV